MKRKKRFPLLVYQRWSKMLRLPSLLIALVSATSYWFVPAWPLSVLTIVGLWIFVYSLLVRHSAYVQCTPEFIKIRTPFTSLVISYKRVRRFRPNEFCQQFPADQLSLTHRRLIKPFVKEKVLVLELGELPMPEKHLRLWLNPFMFANNATGFVFIVEDWTGLSQQISDFIDRWALQRRERQRRIKDALTRRR